VLPRRFHDCENPGDLLRPLKCVKKMPQSDVSASTDAAALGGLCGSGAPFTFGGISGEFIGRNTYHKTPIGVSDLSENFGPFSDRMPRSAPDSLHTRYDFPREFQCSCNPRKYSPRRSTQTKREIVPTGQDCEALKLRGIHDRSPFTFSCFHFTFRPSPNAFLQRHSHR